MRNAIILFFFLVSGSVFGQSAMHKKAERKFQQFEFVAAAKLYEKIIKKNPMDEFAQNRLDQCYNALNFQTMKVHQLIEKKSESGSKSIAEPNPTRQH